MSKSLSLASKLHILVADDIPATRIKLCDMLKTLGHRVMEVQSGREALNAASNSEPDLVLLDLLMPGLDGFEVARQLHQMVTDRWMPVIVMSSLEGEEHLIYALSNGADDYLVRPVSPSMLDAKLRHYARVLGMQNRMATLARRQRVIHDNILDAVITLDELGVVQENNVAAANLLGYSQTVLASKPCELVLGESLVDLLQVTETTLLRGDGTEFPAELVWSSWREQGRMQYTLVIHDLTERRRIERMKDEFLATVSHELRTPLTSVMGSLSLMASGAAGALPKNALDLADVARRNGERLGKLIDDVLDLTKLEGNQMVLHMQDSVLPDLLVEAVSTNQAYADRSGVHLRLFLQENCPPVALDTGRFLQVMANLLSNAVKHSAKGDTVKVSLNWSDEGVSVSVKDSGPGVDPNFRSRMFEKFSQADGTDQRPQGGTGLGLYVSRLFVERMGGTIHCESEPGRGANFILEFPLAEAADKVRQPWLLLVDRNPKACLQVEKWLQPVCKVLAAADLEQARALVQDGPANVVLADPADQGQTLQFCQSLGTLGKTVILYSDSSDQPLADRLGISWLQKDDSGDDLVRSMRVAMRQALREANL